MKAITTLLTVGGLSVASLAFSNVGINDIQRKAAQKIKAAQSSQQNVNKTADQTDQLFLQFQEISKQTEGLRIYNAQLKQQIDDQNRQLTDIDAAIEQATIIERQIAPLTLRMIDTLERFVELDLPFHQQERKRRIEMLRNNFKRSNITIAEKFRQVLEAYKIEREYGRKIDRYKQSIQLDGQEIAVNILRIGRISLLFGSPDKQTIGFWNTETEQWQRLSESHYRRSIDHGLRMAAKQAAVDLLTVPVATPNQVSDIRKGAKP